MHNYSEWLLFSIAKVVLFMYSNVSIKIVLYT